MTFRFSFAAALLFGLAGPAVADLADVAPDIEAAIVAEVPEATELAFAPEITRPVLRPTAAPVISLRPELRPQIPVPTLHWDEFRSGMAAPANPAWGVTLITAIRSRDALLQTVPDDIDTWCPAYEAAGHEDRAAFWAGLVSVLAWYESTHNPRAVGGGGLWFGLIQIAPATARYRECAVGTGQALMDGSANLRCGVRIMAQNVLRDGVVSAGMRGVAAEWGPFHNRGRREAMREWVSSQSYCVAG